MPETPSRIAVLGSGVSGLTTALALAGRGARGVTIYTDRAGPVPASRVAPAMFTPYSPADSPIFRRRTETAFRAFEDLAMDGASGVSMGELREYDYAPAPMPAWLSGLLQVRPLATTAQVSRATTSRRPHIDMDRYLPWLDSRARSEGIGFETIAAADFDAVFARGHSTIINCTGLGSRVLARDPLLKPMHGQVIHVPNDIGLGWSIHDDAPGGFVAYVFQFGDRLVLGGTFDTGREDAETDAPSLDAIVERCRNLLRLDGHPRWMDLARERIEARAAPRPSRGPAGVHEEIRLERQPLPGGRAVIHNYGHGRTGVTLSWGCAAEAAELAAPEMRPG